MDCAALTHRRPARSLTSVRSSESISMCIQRPQPQGVSAHRTNAQAPPPQSLTAAPCIMPPPGRRGRQGLPLGMRRRLDRQVSVRMPRQAGRQAGRRSQLLGRVRQYAHRPNMTPAAFVNAIPRPWIRRLCSRRASAPSAATAALVPIPKARSRPCSPVAASNAAPRTEVIRICGRRTRIDVDWLQENSTRV